MRASSLLGCAPEEDEEKVPAGLARHRRHHFPARNRVVKVRYDDREHAALAAAGAIRRYAVNVNQAVAALHSNGEAPVWLSRAVAGADRAVLSADAATRRVTGRPG